MVLTRELSSPFYRVFTEYMRIDTCYILGQRSPIRSSTSREQVQEGKSHHHHFGAGSL